MNKLKVNRIEDIQGLIKKAGGKFGKARGFAFAEWPDGSLRLIVKRGNYEKTQKGTGEKD